MLTIETIYARARQSPDKIALVHNHNRISYRVFACAIEATRQYLARQGLPDRGTAVVEARTLPYFWLFGLALRGLGKTTIVVPSLSQIGQLGLHDICCVVAPEDEHRPELDAVCAAGGWRLIVVPRAIYAAAASGAPPRPPGLSQLPGGHILLTSGTTGTHKKILIDQHNLTALAAFRREVYGVSEDCVVNLFGFRGWTATGYVRPISIWEAGGTLVLQQRAPAWEAFRYRGITDSVAVPQVVARLVEAPAQALQRDDGMRLVVTAGTLPWKLAQQAMTRVTRRVFSSLASTEGLAIAFTPIEQPDDLRWHRILPSREVQIVDEHDRELPPGQLGMIRVRLLPGMGEYLDDPEATREFFRDGYFYPGDLGVIEPDGRLALHGRASDVVNILGSKIATKPIEDMLQTKFGVGGVCIFSPSDPSVAELHVAIEASRAIAAADLAAALHPMMPRVWGVGVRSHVMAAMPRNHMGKIQRNLVKEQLGIS